MDPLPVSSAEQLGVFLCTINSSCTPLTVEVKEAQLALQRDGDELLHIESTINNLRAEIEAIHKRISLQQETRRAVQARIFTNKARISPVRFLPTEILQHIFKACLPNDQYIIPYTQSAPLLLCQICRRWRDVAEATPELWSSIYVQDWGVWTAELYLEMVVRWLAASRTRPLAIRVVCHQKWNRFRQCDLVQSRLLRLLVSHSARLHDLHIQATHGYIDAFLAGGSPAVKHILISVIPTVSPNYAHPLPLCSNITHLGLCGRDASTNLIPPATFHQITHLTLDRLGAEINFMEILIEFPALVQLKARLFGIMDVTCPSPDAVPLKHCALEILSIYLSGDVIQFGKVTPLARTFDSLSLPALRELAFVALDPGREASVDDWLPDSVKALFARSSRSAKRLIYRNFRRLLDTNGLREQLRSVAVDLTVDNMNFDFPSYDMLV
ncbi:hypothetical protein AZE42_09992 [Rhizopogon vesiculosus]|uniref:F-box domain-containing protein n=1 Tax=Rhizopogon vesiculosus TaxID=180088 RepID=A0A1J8PRM6_9AGAM|nr:hypothetical protein AZE42_09992 [Rhizopogon vesiculosus]